MRTRVGRNREAESLPRASCAIDRLLRHEGHCKAVWVFTMRNLKRRRTLCKTQEEHPAQQMYTLVR